MRLLTRSDFDGLACGAILRELGIVNSWKFIHPKDLQDGLIQVEEEDVLANVPYMPGCRLWFDHHSSESERVGGRARVEGQNRPADSTARVIYEYYGGKERLPHFEEMVQAVDKVDSARLTLEDIQDPTGWVLLGFIMDPRTGLGRFRDFRISNYDLMEDLIEACRHQTIEEILNNLDVQERIELYYEQMDSFCEMLQIYSRVEGNVILTDLRGVEPIYAGNRFMIYCMYPEQNISIWVVDGRAKLNCAMAAGHSILNPTSKTDIGALLLQYGGGGNAAVGTCQVPYEVADRVIAELMEQMQRDG